MIESYTVNPDADAEHQRGLVLEVKKHDYAAAHAAFDTALGLIMSADGGDPSARMQTARVMRDDGFTYVREYKSGATNAGRTAGYQLDSSAEITDDLIGKGEEEHAPEAWRYLQSEHGATIGLKARLAAVRHVMGENVSLDDVLDLHSQAAGHLENGSNRYYEASNAMNAARVARLKRGGNLGNWLGISMATLCDAALEDKSNLLRTFATVVGRQFTIIGPKPIVKRSILWLP